MLNPDAPPFLCLHLMNGKGWTRVGNLVLSPLAGAVELMGDLNDPTLNTPLLHCPLQLSGIRAFHHNYKGRL